MILQRYVFRELLLSFWFTFCTVMAICLVGTMFQIFRAFPGLGFTIMLQMMPLAIGSTASWVLLVASCTSGTLVYGRLAAENEITAMRTCGIRMARIVMPAVLLGLLLVGAAYLLNEVVVPWSRYSRRVVLRQSTFAALKLPPPGTQEFKIGSIRLSYTDFRDGRMERPTIAKFKGETMVEEFFAPSGGIIVEGDVIKVTLSKPRYRVFGKERIEYFSAESDFTTVLDSEEYDKQRSVGDLPAPVLWQKYFESRTPAEANSALLIVATRYAASLAPLLLMLVAVPIGIFVRKGSRLAGLGAALPPLLIYFVTYFLFQGLGDKGRVPALVAAFAPDALLAAVGGFLLFRASRT